MARRDGIIILKDFMDFYLFTRSELTMADFWESLALYFFTAIVYYLELRSTSKSEPS
jgi:hypothetical protein